jgi:hypothetical protein
MSVLSVNCHGLGGDVTIRDLRVLTERHTPYLLCVVETQLHKTRVKNLAHSLHFDKCFAISSSGRSGGIAIFLE